MDDLDGLGRFVSAQNDVLDTVLAELRRGRKTSHWMWFVFPQLAGLGRSPTAEHYAITGLAQARAYLAHSVLGDRLRRCARLVADSDTADATTFLGPVDALKLRSSMTLFHRADPDEPAFAAVLDRYYGGEPDPATELLLGGGPRGRPAGTQGSGTQG